MESSKSKIEDLETCFSHSAKSDWISTNVFERSLIFYMIYIQIVATYSLNININYISISVSLAVSDWLGNMIEDKQHNRKESLSDKQRNWLTSEKILQIVHGTTDVDSKQLMELKFTGTNEANKQKCRRMTFPESLDSE